MVAISFFKLNTHLFQLQYILLCIENLEYTLLVSLWFNYINRQWQVISPD